MVKMNKWSCAVAGQSPDPSIITVLQLCLSPKGPEFKGTRDPQSQLGAEARISELQQEGDRSLESSTDAEGRKNIQEDI